MDASLLSEFLECSVCLETMDGTSKVLPCQHTFCKRCLDDIVESQKELMCPECRLRVTTKVEDLPPNILLARLIEGLKKTRLSSEAEDKSPESQNGQNRTNLVKSNVGSSRAPDAKGIDVPAPAPSPNSMTMNVIGIPTSEAQNDQKADASPRHVQNAQRPCAKALYSYLSPPPGQLSFKVGDVIYLHDRREDWFYGELEGRRGIFPKRYVKVLVPLPPSQPLQGLPLPTIIAHAPQCVALYDFDDQTTSQSNENGSRDKCLKFKAGEIITVLRRVDANWALGKLNGNVGIFPLPFVQLNQFARALLKHSNASSPGVSTPSPMPPTASTNPPMTTPASQNGNGIQNRAPTSGPENGSTSSVPVALGVGNVARSRTAFCQPSPTASPPPRLPFSPDATPAGLPDLLRNEFDPLLADSSTRDGSDQAGNPRRGASPCNVAAANSSGATTPADGKAPVTAAAPPGRQMTSSQCAHAQFQGATVEAIYPYSQQKPDELELIKGDLYRVVEVCKDHWFRGTHLKTGRVGVFPGNYVRPARPIVPGPVPPRSTQATPDLNLADSPSPVPSGATSPPSFATPSRIPGHVRQLPAAVAKKSSTKRRSSASAAQSASTGCLDEPGAAGGVHAWGQGAGFEDDFVPFGGGEESDNPLHSRSGSCPSQLINVSSYAQSGSSSRMSSAPLAVKLPQRIFRSVSTANEAARNSEALSVSSGNPRSRAKTPPTGIVIDRYRCILSYPAASPQELNLAEGDVVFVQRKAKTRASEQDASSPSSSSSDGWLKGRHAKSGAVGYFPAMFVQKF